MQIVADDDDIEGARGGEGLRCAGGIAGLEVHLQGGNPIVFGGQRGQGDGLPVHAGCPPAARPGQPDMPPAAGRKVQNMASGRGGCRQEARHPAARRNGRLFGAGQFGVGQFGASQFGGGQFGGGRFSHRVESPSVDAR